MGGGNRRDRSDRASEYRNRIPTDGTVAAAQQRLNSVRDDPVTVGRVAGGAFGGAVGGSAGGPIGSTVGATVGREAGERAGLRYAGEDGEDGTDPSVAGEYVGTAGGVVGGLFGASSTGSAVGSALGRETARRLAAEYADPPDDDELLDTISGYSDTVSEALDHAGFEDASDIREASLTEIVEATQFSEQDARDIKRRSGSSE